MSAVQFRGPFLYSISRLSAEFGTARESVARRLKDAGVRASGQRHGYPVYRACDAIPAMLGAGSNHDPARMTPSDRRAWYQSENLRLKYERAIGQLVSASDVREQFTIMVKIVVQALERLPDELERDLCCEPKVTEYVEEKINKLRQQIADKIARH